MYKFQNFKKFLYKKVLFKKKLENKDKTLI